MHDILIECQFWSRNLFWYWIWYWK